MNEMLRYSEPSTDYPREKGCPVRWINRDKPLDGIRVIFASSVSDDDATRTVRIFAQSPYMLDAIGEFLDAIDDDENEQTFPETSAVSFMRQARQLALDLPAKENISVGERGVW